MVKIFVVDDYVNFLQLFRDAFSSKGIEVYTESDSTNAVERILEVQPNIVFLDMFMPGKDGVQVFQELRKRGFDKRIVFVSGAPWRDIRDKIEILEESCELIRKGGCEFLDKIELCLVEEGFFDAAANS